ncbi:MAG: PQQ-binding-like beta-propeller repeat protein [Candidatus Sumerlaeota bacterium]|nr:PQQ-binding-like beta-propeller repeat protein [Candidatus Sumerlaeota bacterium]
MKRRMCLMAFVGLLLSGLPAADWPQFLGPNRDGVSTEEIAKTWPPSGPKVLWTFPLGPGYGGAAISGGEVYVLDRVEEKQDVLRCVDLASGKELWSLPQDAPADYTNPGSRAVPTIDVENVYAVGPGGDMYCVNRKSHALVWRVNLLQAFESKESKWAISQSPTPYKNWMVVATQGAKAGVVALDKATGQAAWQSPALPGGESYVSPRGVTIDGVDQFIMTMAGKGGGRRSGGGRGGAADAGGEGSAAGGGGGGSVSGIDANTGNALWNYGGFQCQIPIAAAVPVGEGRFLFTGGYNAGAAMIQVKKQGEQFAVTELWKNNELNSQIHQPLLIGGFLYANSNSNETKEGMECLTLDGQLKWRTGNNMFERGNLFSAGGLIINQEGDSGSLRLVEPSPEGYKELAVANLGLSKKAWGPMALSNGHLVIRDQQKMMCLDVKNP